MATTQTETNSPSSLTGAIDLPLRKTGSGRPPKDGIMSARERRALQKAQRLGRVAAVKEGQAPSLENRKRKGKGDDDIPRKQARPRSASPEYFLLKRLIYDILIGIHPGSLSLKEIYRALKFKYPFYVYRVQSDRRRSSVQRVLKESSRLFERLEKGKRIEWRAIVTGGIPCAPDQTSPTEDVADEDPEATASDGTESECWSQQEDAENVDSEVTASNPLPSSVCEFYQETNLSPPDIQREESVSIPSLEPQLLICYSIYTTTMGIPKEALMRWPLSS